MLSLVGCAGATEPENAVTVPRVEHPATSGLVWIEGPTGQQSTLWVSLGGAMLASQPIEGPLWSEGGALWQWATERERSPGPPEVLVTRAYLRELVDDATAEVVAPPERALAHTVELMASVGPFLFGREERVAGGDPSMADGPDVRTHPELHVWDLRTGGHADVLTDRERGLLRRTRSPQARGALCAGNADACRVRLVGLIPRWEENRDLHVAVTYASEADPTQIWEADSGFVPERLAPYATAPAWAVHALGRTPGARLLGFSRVTEDGPASILETLRR